VGNEPPAADDSSTTFVLERNGYRHPVGLRRRLLVCAALAVPVVRGELPPGSASAATTYRVDQAILSVAAGAYTGYALLGDGNVWAWGDDLEGQTGDGGNRTIRELPVEVRGLSSATSLAGGANTVYALRSDGTVWAWGDDFEGELGSNVASDVNLPRLVKGLNAVSGIAAGAFAGYAVRGGTAWAWGDNAFGQLGSGSSSSIAIVPVEVVHLADVIAVTGDTSDGYALLRSGSVWGWGADFARQLGAGKCPSTRTGPNRVCLGSTVPRQVPGLAGVMAIAAGGNAGFALLRNGTVWGWGDDECGELGNGTRTVDEALPVEVKGLRHVIAIAAGACSAYAVLSNGTVWSWGEGNNGELGDGKDSNSSVPVQVRGLSDAVQVAGGGAMAYALERNGSVWAWGDNAYGQLGDGSLLSRDRPVRVLGLPKP
jgi:alpha-tubulin suppressor-like RCC1 family protein